SDLTRRAAVAGTVPFAQHASSAGNAAPITRSFPTARTGMHSLESQLAKQLASHDWQSVTSLVAVSGGADSVALLRGLVALRSQGAARLVVVHFHHGLRDEADADAAFVQELAAAHELTCEVGYAAPGALAGEGDSLEAAARDARYRFFLSVASAAGARYLF